jgi:hypothetical protein
VYRYLDSLSGGGVVPTRLTAATVMPALHRGNALAHHPRSGSAPAGAMFDHRRGNNVPSAE